MLISRGPVAYLTINLPIYSGPVALSAAALRRSERGTAAELSATSAWVRVPSWERQLPAQNITRMNWAMGSHIQLLSGSHFLSGAERCRHGLDQPF
jgi:hypothetical protein